MQEYAAFCCIAAEQAAHDAKHGEEIYGCHPPPPTHRGRTGDIDMAVGGEGGLEGCNVYA